MDKEALQNDHKHLKVLKSASKSTQRTQRQPKGSPKGPQRVPKWSQGAQKAPQKAPKRHPKAIPKPEKKKNRHLGFNFPLNVSKTHACAVRLALEKIRIPPTCLSKGTGSAFKGGEFAKHVSTSVRTPMRRRVRNT